MNPVPNDSDARGAWVERAVALLDRSVQTLDASTLSQLNTARQKALAQRRGAARDWLLGGGLAVAAIVLAIALNGGDRSVSPQMPRNDAASVSADADPLADDDSLDLYENLDFYAWLDAQRPDGNG